MAISRRQVLATGLAGPAFLATRPARAATRITILYTAVSPYAGSFVAKDQGFFAKRGLEVDFVLAANGSLVMAGLVGGSAQIGTPTPTVFVQAVDAGIDGVALASTNQYPETTKSGLVARTGLEIKAPADLIGKKVGVPGLGGLLDVVMRKWLIDAKVDPARVVFIETSFAQMPDSLRSGQVDAVISTDPFLSRAVGSGVGYFVADCSRSLPAGTIASVYAATRSWAEANPAAVKSFQEAILEAVTFARSHETETRDSIARYTKLPPEVVASMAIPNLSAQVSAQQIGFWIDLCREQKLVTGKLDAAALVVPWQAGS